MVIERDIDRFTGIRAERELVPVASKIDLVDALEARYFTKNGWSTFSIESRTVELAVFARRTSSWKWYGVAIIKIPPTVATILTIKLFVYLRPPLNLHRNCHWFIADHCGEFGAVRFAAFVPATSHFFVRAVEGAGDFAAVVAGAEVLEFLFEEFQGAVAEGFGGEVFVGVFYIGIGLVDDIGDDDAEDDQKRENAQRDDGDDAFWRMFTGEHGQGEKIT